MAITAEIKDGKFVLIYTDGGETKRLVIDDLGKFHELIKNEIARRANEVSTNC